MSDSVSITGLSKALVLAALYNRARPQGMGFLHYIPEPMTEEIAQKILDRGVTRFDYLVGRVMKVDISGDEFNAWAFDRDNGEGAAQQTITTLRETNDPNHPTIQSAHEASRAAAEEERRRA